MDAGHSACDAALQLHNSDRRTVDTRTRHAPVLRRTIPSAPAARRDFPDREHARAVFRSRDGVATRSLDAWIVGVDLGPAWKGGFYADLLHQGARRLVHPADRYRAVPAD